MSITQVEYYYDSHPTEEDLIGESDLQDVLIHYLRLVLEWLYHVEGWYIARNLNIYQTDNTREPPLAPDIAIFIGYVRPKDPHKYRKSWRVRRPDSPPPSVVFEVASAKTWEKDIETKPVLYARMGAAEYFYYDPRPEEEVETARLMGWRTVEGRAEPMAPDRSGRLWSSELESWLAPDGDMLRLVDPLGHRRLTEAEAVRLMMQEERSAKERERLAKEQEQLAKEQERLAKERAWARLRELGIDPEGL